MCELKSIKKEIQKEIKINIKNKNENIRNRRRDIIMTGTEREIWSMIKNIQKKISYDIPVINIFSNTNIKAQTLQEGHEIYMNHFKTLSFEENKSRTFKYDNKYTNAQFSETTDTEITAIEIITILKSISNNKAEGLDNIPVELYKLITEDTKCEKPMTKRIQNELNEIFNSCEFPITWDDSFIVPLYKKVMFST